MVERTDNRLLLALALILALASCNTSGYKTFTLKKGIAHFSFEYPASYRITRLEVKDDEEHKYTDVGLFLRISGGERIPAVVDVFIDDVSSHYPNSGVLMEERLSIFPRVKKGFSLLGRSTLKVDGISGQLIVYSWAPPAAEPESVISREVYFDTRGIIWHLSLDSSETRAETAKADFEHILGTFKIVGQRLLLLPMKSGLLALTE